MSGAHTVVAFLQFCTCSGLVTQDSRPVVLNETNVDKIVQPVQPACFTLVLQNIQEHTRQYSDISSIQILQKAALREAHSDGDSCMHMLKGSSRKCYA